MGDPTNRSAATPQPRHDGEIDEARYRTKEFGVTVERLRQVMRRVGLNSDESPPAFALNSIVVW